MVYAPSWQAKIKIHEEDHLGGRWSFDNPMPRRIVLYGAGQRNGMRMRGNSFGGDSSCVEKRTSARGVKALIVERSSF